MNLSERLPRSITALLGMNPRKHVWSGFNQLNKILAGMRRHDYFGVNNWELKVKPLLVEVAEKSAKRGGQASRKAL